jgi:fluoride ion exporter CrcB/FEX
MMRNGNHITALMYIILSVVIGILSTFIGSYIFK